jgi:copper homeostasis protein
MARLLLEVIALTVDDARAAAEGGADRLEIVRDIRQGGLTPPLELVRDIAAAVTLPLRVMVRENAGYELHRGELTALRKAVGDFAAAGVSGVVVGFARAGKLALDDVKRVLDEAPEVRATFHRAFDSLFDPLAAIDEIARVPQIDRILTSGGDGTARERCARLRQYGERAGARLTIIAGAGVDDEMLAAIARTGCVAEAHVGRAAREGDDPEGRVSVARVRRLRELADGG